MSLLNTNKELLEFIKIIYKKKLNLLNMHYNVVAKKEMIYL